MKLSWNQQLNLSQAISWSLEVTGTEAPDMPKTFAYFLQKTRQLPQLSALPMNVDIPLLPANKKNFDHGASLLNFIEFLISLKQNCHDLPALPYLPYTRRLKRSGDTTCSSIEGHARPSDSPGGTFQPAHSSAALHDRKAQAFAGHTPGTKNHIQNPNNWDCSGWKLARFECKTHQKANCQSPCCRTACQEPRQRPDPDPSKPWNGVEEPQLGYQNWIKMHSSVFSCYSSIF